MKQSIHFAIITTLLFFIVGCETMTDRQRTETEGALAGCGAGAVLGNIVGNDTKSTATGCVLGMMAGGTYGKHVADKKEAYQSTEAHFQAMIDNAQQVAHNASAYNNTLQGQITSVKQRQAKLEASTENALSKQMKLIAHKNKTNKLLKQTEQQLTRIAEEIRRQKAFLAQHHNQVDGNLVRASQQQISSLERETRALEIALAELKAIDNRRVY